MPADPRETPGQMPDQSLRFLLLYALACAGGAVSYVPFLTLLLPLHVKGLAGVGTIDTLAYIAFSGAIAASLANIAFGWISDITRNRRGWIGAGLVLSCLLLVSVRETDSLVELLVLIVIWQCSLNMMLAPLAAWAGDCVPDDQKGMLGGLLALSPAMGAGAGVIITLPGVAEGDMRLVLVAAMAAVMVLPVLLFGNPRPMPQLMVSDMPPSPAQTPHMPAGAVARMWSARLLVQIAEAALFAYLLIWLGSIDSTVDENQTATIFTIVLGISVPLAMLAGHWSDRANRPAVPLVIGAGIGAVGLIGMGLSHSLTTALAGYIVFGLSTSVFLALHSSQTLRVLPKPATRGRDLGLFNLTNTVPSLIMPWLTLALVPVFGFQALFFVLALLALVAMLLLLSLTRRI